MWAQIGRRVTRRGRIALPIITTGQKLGQNHRFQTWPDGLTDVVVPQRLVAKKRRKVVQGGRFNVEQSPTVVRHQWCGNRFLR